MTALSSARARTIARRIRRAEADEIHDLYIEVIGCDFGGKVTVDRARESIAEVITECFTPRSTGEEPNMTTTTQTNDNGPAELAGLLSLDVEPETTKKPRARKAKQEKTAKPARAAKTTRAAKAPHTPTILLKNPDIKRDKDGKIVHIIGTCTWKGCTKTRKIHAADAFQVRYCLEHKKEAVKLARRERMAKASKKKTKH